MNHLQRDGYNALLADHVALVARVEQLETEIAHLTTALADLQRINNEINTAWRADRKSIASAIKHE